MADPFASFSETPNSFGRAGAVITPGASDLAVIPKGVVCLTGGDVTIVPLSNANGDTLTFTGLPAGYIIPFRVRRVTAATATVASIL
jgi:hypothetical protein